MLDRDLAAIYKVETKRLKEQVKRNSSRFPPAYMFVLTPEEHAALRSQIATSKNGRGGVRYAPMAFTEYGVLQLANVLKSDRAEKMSFIVIDVFVRFREMIVDTAEIREMIEEIKRKTENNTKNIELLVNYLDELIDKKEKLPPRNPIEFK